MFFFSVLAALDIATRKNHQEIVAMIRHPPPVKKTENSAVVKAEINITHDSEESKHQHKKVIGRWNSTKKSKVYMVAASTID